MGTSAYVCPTCRSMQLVLGQGGREGRHLAPTACSWIPDGQDYICGSKVVEVIEEEIDGLLQLLASMWISGGGSTKHLVSWADE